MIKKIVTLIMVAAMMVFLLPGFAIAGDEQISAAAGTEQPSDPARPSDSARPTDKPQDLIQVKEPVSFKWESGDKKMVTVPADKKEELSVSEKKLSARLLQLADDKFLPPGKSRDAVVSDMTRQNQMKIAPVTNGTSKSASGTSVHVYIKLNNSSGKDMLSPYAQIEDIDTENSLAAAWVDIDSLNVIASLDAVLGIREVIPPVVNAGSALSEGDSILKADLARAQTGADGAGVKVGIISDGVNNYQSAVASGDLPSNVTILSNNEGGDEGTAMMEIVHDLAPGAQLYFHDYGDSALAFNEAITELADAGCGIICDDVLWFNQPFFEDGVIAQHVRDMLASRGIMYVTSAGNSAVSHYQGVFRDLGDGYKTDDFSGNGTDPYLYEYVPAGGWVQIVMQWSDPFGNSGNDYDLHIYNYATLGLVAESVDAQNGYDDPFEAVYYYNNTGSDVDIIIRASAYDVYEDNIIEIYTYGGGSQMYANNIVAGDSIFGQAAVPGVLACGAIDGNSGDTDYGDIEYYSSQGPVTMLTETRQKPDICGVDGVSVTGAGGFYNPFYGTSAAAPHIAAIAALLKSSYPYYSYTDIRQLILDNGVDKGSAGYDSIFGYGEADALAAASDVVSYTISASPNNAAYGIVTGGGPYNLGAAATLTATPNNGYRFVRWTENSSAVSANLVYTFTVTGERSLIAEFAALTPVGIICSKTDSTIYGGANGSVTITASGGDSGTYEYSINGGAGWQSAGYFGNIAAGTYTAAVRDAGYVNNIATCSVIVAQPPNMGSFAANRIPARVNVGTALTIVPPAAPRGYTTVSVTYASSNPSVAAADASGNVTFLAGGRVIIITTIVSQMTDARGRVRTRTSVIRRTVTVLQPVASIALNLTDASVIRTQRVRLLATVAPSTASNKQVRWTSSNPRVAAVSGAGVVTGRSVGTAVITCIARDGSGVSASCTVTVTPIYPSGIRISRAALILRTGRAYSLRAAVLPYNTDFKTVTWTSSNTSIAAVDARGKVTAVSAGTATVTATTSNGISASCAVTVQ